MEEEKDYGELFKKQIHSLNKMGEDGLISEGEKEKFREGILQNLANSFLQDSRPDEGEGKDLGNKIGSIQDLHEKVSSIQQSLEEVDHKFYRLTQEFERRSYEENRQKEREKEERDESLRYREAKLRLSKSSALGVGFIMAFLTLSVVLIASNWLGTEDIGGRFSLYFFSGGSGVVCAEAFRKALSS